MHQTKEMIICPNWVRTTGKLAPSGVLLIWEFTSRDTKIFILLECVTLSSLSSRMGIREGECVEVLKKQGGLLDLQCLLLAKRN